MLIYRKPPEEIEYLKLQLPAAAFGQRGSLRFKIPKQMINKTEEADPEKPDPEKPDPEKPDPSKEVDKDDLAQAPAGSNELRHYRFGNHAGGVATG
ncbi:MAG: hypothetical protein V3V75_05120 [Thermoguttaceae bacterium]